MVFASFFYLLYSGRNLFRFLNGFQIRAAHIEQLLFAITTHLTISSIHFQKSPLHIGQPKSTHGCLQDGYVLILTLQ